MDRDFRARLQVADRNELLDLMTAYHCSQENKRPSPRHRRKVKDAYIKTHTNTIRAMVFAILGPRIEEGDEPSSNP